jgi:putative transposase
MAERAYPSDLSDAEWSLLEPLLPPPALTGRPRKWPTRLVMAAVFYVLRTGCGWRALPTSFPPWQTVYHHFRRWRLEGVWPKVNAALRTRVRVRAGREAEPSAAIIDSQSVKTTEQGGPRGFDGHKKVNGRKRHLLVDTNGLLLEVVVHPADVSDREGGKRLLERVAGKAPRLEHIWADQGYTGGFQRWAEHRLGVRVEVVYPWWRQLKRYAPELLEGTSYKPGEFNVLPRRWVVERTFAWLGRCRRLSKDYERLPETEEAFVRAAMVRLMLARLVKA